MGNLAGKAEGSGRHAQRVIVGQSTEIKTKDSEPPGEMGRRAVEFILLVLAGLALAVALRLVVPGVAFGPRFDQILIFAAGAAAAVLVLRWTGRRSSSSGYIAPRLPADSSPIGSRN